MKPTCLLAVLALAGCGAGQPGSTPVDQAIDDATASFDFNNYSGFTASFESLSSKVAEHEPVYLKLSVAHAPQQTLYLGQVDARMPLEKLRLHVPNVVRQIDFELFNARGFTHSGSIML